MARKLRFVALALVFLFVGSQFIRPDRTNPPIDAASTFEAVAKPDAGFAAIVKRACYDCHSNQTVWPWYSQVAPVSWLVADDVKEGRAHLNFSEWGMLGPDAAKLRLQAICDEVKGGDMPLWQYRLNHPEARLSAEDVKSLCGLPTR
jgi:hypothetical protein